MTPWIAMISCDVNATNASQEEDVFTLARDKGAVAAVGQFSIVLASLYLTRTKSFYIQNTPLRVSSIPSTQIRKHLIKFSTFSRLKV